MVHYLDGDVAGHMSTDDTGGAAWWSCKARWKAILAVIAEIDDVVAPWNGKGDSNRAMVFM
jgi:hypothetical protein